MAIMVSIHAHPVSLVPKESDSTNWICDGSKLPAGCRQNCTSFSQTKGWTRYRCEKCDFDLCESCFTANVVHGIYVKCHPHVLLVLNRDNGWSCDGMKIPGGCAKGCNGFNQTRGWLRHNCVVCDYDLCEGCIAKHIDEVKVSVHPHPMRHIFKDNGWACDGRRLAGGCRSGCTGFLQTWSLQRYQCEECDYDLCYACAAANTVIVPPSPKVEQARGVVDKSAANKNNTPKDDEDLKLCVICMEQPKNASIIHGDTGHQACCIECAKSLHAAKKTCPICRAKIDAVVHNYVV